jgi:polyketide cyclase/dehydrase/lipid transport protein
MISFESSIELGRTRGEVFDYVADAGRLAEWNLAVMTVDPSPDTPGHHVMRRELPTGVAINEIAITAHRPDEMTLRTITGPTPFVYRYTFDSIPRGTRIRLQAEMDLGGIARLAQPLAAHGLRRGVDANLGSLRTILESTRSH